MKVKPMEVKHPKKVDSNEGNLVKMVTLNKVALVVMVEIMMGKQKVERVVPVLAL